MTIAQLQRYLVSRSHFKMWNFAVATVLLCFVFAKPSHAWQSTELELYDLVWRALVSHTHSERVSNDTLSYRSTLFRRTFVCLLFFFFSIFYLLIFGTDTLLDVAPTADASEIRKVTHTYIQSTHQ